MNDYQVVNRVDSLGRVVGHWVARAATINVTDQLGAIHGSVTPPLPWSGDMTFEFYVNALGGAMLDTSPFHTALPSTIDLSDAFDDAGLRLPNDSNGNPISGVFSLIDASGSLARVSPSWWNGIPFSLNEGFTGGCQLTPGNLLHFLCDGGFSFKSVDRAWLYKNGVWTNAYIELARSLDFVTWK